MDDWDLSCALHSAFRLGALLQNLRSNNVNTLSEIQAMELELEELLKQVAEGDLMLIDTHDRDQANISSVQADTKEQASRLLLAIGYRKEQLVRFAKDEAEEDGTS